MANGNYIAAYSNGSSTTMEHTAGMDCKVVGTRPNPLSGTNNIQDTFAFKTKTIQTPGGPKEVCIPEYNAGERQTKDVESSNPGGKYARISMSSMAFYAGGTMSLQGNSSLICCFQGGPINFVTPEFSVMGVSTYIAASQALEITSQNISIKASDIEISGNVVFNENVNIGGSLNVQGELYAPHLTCLQQVEITRNQMGMMPRINEDSHFCLLDCVESSLGKMTATISIAGMVNGAPGAVTGIAEITLPTFIKIPVKIASITYAAGVPDIVECNHCHQYITPQFEACGSAAQVNEQGIEATSKANMVDGLKTAEATNHKKRNYNMISMISKFVGDQVKTRVKNAGKAIIKSIGLGL